jgi:hypothetical protein
MAPWCQMLLPIIALGCNILVQIGGYRIVSKKNLLRSIYIGFLAGMAFLIAGECILSLKESAVTLNSLGYGAANILLYGALGYGYFHFINLGETGRRVRLMWELSEASEGYTEEELLKRYGGSEIAKIRLGRLLRSGQITFENGCYRVSKPTVLTMARLMVALKVLLLKKSSEFD